MEWHAACDDTLFLRRAGTQTSTALSHHQINCIIVCHLQLPLRHAKVSMLGPVLRSANS